MQLALYKANIREHNHIHLLSHSNLVQATIAIKLLAYKFKNDELDVTEVLAEIVATQLDFAILACKISLVIAGLTLL